jgi:enoyl-CoA hydratase/carnithine racemase
MTHPRLSVDGTIARIVLDRPERHNALEAEELDRFRDHLAQVNAASEVRALVVTGAGSETFCSGASLDEVESGAMSGRVFETLTRDLAACRVPTICALNGSAYGGGTEIALCCDFRIGVSGMRMSVPAARLGVCYPASGLRRFVAAIGLSATRRVMLAGEALETEEMLDVGFLDWLVPADDLVSATEELADRLAGLAPLAVQAMKRVLASLRTGDLGDDEIAELVRRCQESEDLREGLRARREGRPAEFRGR